MKNNLGKLVLKIIVEQEKIMGPIAWYYATKVRGIQVINRDMKIVEINDDDFILDKLVEKYESILGKISREICMQIINNSAENKNKFSK